MPATGNGHYPPQFGGTLARIEGILTYQQVAGATLVTPEGRQFIIPKGARPVDEYLEIGTVFNAETTNVLKIGLGADDDYFYASAAGGAAAVLRYGASGSVLGRMNVTIQADTPVTGTYSQSGAAASAGAAKYVLIYCMPDE